MVDWIGKIHKMASSLLLVICCLNFCDEACWILSLRIFGLLCSSLLLFLQRFGWYVLRPSSGVCRTQEPSRNFELRPLLLCSYLTRITTIIYDFLPVLIFNFFFSSSLLNYRFPYCIQLYTWSTQQVIVAQHICWFLLGVRVILLRVINCRFEIIGSYGIILYYY